MRRRNNPFDSPPYSEPADHQPESKTGRITIEETVPRVANERPSRRRPYLIVAGLCTMAALLSVLVPALARFVDVDRCLDRGGAYDYASARCMPILPSRLSPE